MMAEMRSGAGRGPKLQTRSKRKAKQRTREVPPARKARVVIAAQSPASQVNLHHRRQRLINVFCFSYMCTWLTMSIKIKSITNLRPTKMTPLIRVQSLVAKHYSDRTRRSAKESLARVRKGRTRPVGKKRPANVPDQDLKSKQKQKTKKRNGKPRRRLRNRKN